MHNTITQTGLFRPGDRVAIGASGGKGMQENYSAQGSMKSEIP